MNNWLDFNDAATQQRDPINPEARKADLKQRLIDNLPSVLQYLLPAGKFQNNKFYIGDVHGTPGTSTEIETSDGNAGVWFDHATGEGGDILSLWGKVHRLDSVSDFSKILDEVDRWFGSFHPQPAYSTPKAPPTDELGPITGKWDYFDANGNLIACVYRYDSPGGKQFRPWDVKARKMRTPNPRPLYNQPGIKNSHDIVLVEGEKAAQALINQSITATTAMNGAKAPVDKTDWSPLKGKRVLIWPDNDQPGQEYALRAAQALQEAGVTSVAIMGIPADKSEKWDAADAVNEGMDILTFLSTANSEVLSESRGVQLLDWTANQYAGEAPEQKFLVDEVFPMGVASILAAMGDTGKGMLTLDLAFHVATGSPPEINVCPQPIAFGREIKEFGTAVVFTAEDDQHEVHRRFQRLDPAGYRLREPERLIVVPLPNAGGPIPLVASGKNGPEATEQFLRIQEQLLALDDLKLIVFDPLSSFIHADITADPAAGSFATGLFASLATGTGAAVIIAHHMRKPQGNKPISSAEQARDAIRGSSALVDGVRMAYSLWPAKSDKQEEVFKLLKQNFVRNAVFQGAVVKSNGPADRKVRTYMRSPTGLLEDITEDLQRAKLSTDDLNELLIKTIGRAAKNGRPFTHTGGSGVFKQRNRLPKAFHTVSRHRLEKMVQELMNQRPAKIVKGMASGSHEPKWLDIPDGPFAQGDGEFIHGADEVKE
ncbi:AAA family ATPase [Magnetococcales bacterium HHB-1]